METKDCGLLDLLRNGNLECISTELHSLESNLKEERQLSSYRDQIINSLLKAQPIPKPPDNSPDIQKLYETVSKDYERQTSVENFSLDQFITGIYHSIASATENNKYTYQKIFEQYYERRLETRLENGVPVEHEIYRPKTIQVELENGKINVPLVSIFPHELPRLNEFSADFETSLSSLQSSKIVRDYQSRGFLEDILRQKGLENLTWKQFLTIYRALTIQLPNFNTPNVNDPTDYVEINFKGRKEMIPVKSINSTNLQIGCYLFTKSALEYYANNPEHLKLWTQTQLIDTSEGYQLENLVPVVFAVGNCFVTIIYFRKSDLQFDIESVSSSFSSVADRLEELYSDLVYSYVLGPQTVKRQFDLIYESFKKWANLYLIDLDSIGVTLAGLLSQITSNRDGLSLQMKIDQPKPDLRTVKMNLKFTYSDNNNGLERVNDILANQIIVT